MVKKSDKKSQRMVYHGSKIGYQWDVAEYGNDKKGNYAILNVLAPLEDDQPIVWANEITENSISTVFEKPAATPDDVLARAEVLLDVIAETKTVEIEGGENLEAGISGITSGPEKKVKEKKANHQEKTLVVQVSLEIALTEDEKTLAAKNAAITSKRSAEAKDAEKLRSSSEKAKIKALESETHRLTEEHNTGIGLRLVQATQRFCFDSQTTWYEYRGAQYEKREMNDVERREMRQKNLFNEPPMLTHKPAAVDLPTTADPKKIEKKMKNEIDEFSKAKKNKKPVLQNETPYSTKDQEIADVMRSEKKKGGKHDHSI